MRNEMNIGKFICVDGIDGSYKSSSVTYLKEYLNSKGIRTTATREPGGTLTAEKIRSILLETYEEKINENTELLLMYASRCQHVENLIKPKLNNGEWVISDRFSSSTIAYQSFGRGISIEKVNQIEKIALDGFKPNLTFIMDVDPVIGLKRAKKRGVLDRIEKENIDFFYRAREGFLHQARLNPELFIVFDASGDFNDLKEQFSFHINKLLTT